MRLNLSRSPNVIFSAQLESFANIDPPTRVQITFLFAALLSGEAVRAYEGL